MKSFLQILLVLISTLSFSTPLLAGGPYNWPPNASSTARKLRLYIPPSLDSQTIRGILFYCNGAGGDSLNMAQDAELVAFAESIGFAVIGTAKWTNFPISQSNTTWEFDLFLSYLDELAGLSGHEELNDAPWLPFGFSNGGQMSFGMNVLAPSKVIAFIANKGDTYNANTLPSNSPALKTPGILIAGELDNGLSAIYSRFINNRANGALWAWMQEQGLGHAIGESRRYALPFFAECVRLRYPANASPENGPVDLVDLDEEDGWTVEWSVAGTDDDGLTEIYPFDDDGHDFGWVPNERIAFLFRAFSSYDKYAGATSSTGTPVANGASLISTSPADIDFEVNMTNNTGWDHIDFYEGKTPIGTVYKNSLSPGQQPKVTLQDVASGGYYVFHGKVTRTGGHPESTTKLHPVYVAGALDEEEDPDPPSTPTPTPTPYDVLVDFGSSGNFTVAAGEDGLNTWNNITNHTSSTPLALKNTANATTGVSLAITGNASNPFSGVATTGTTSTGLYPIDAKRDSFYFDNGRKPELTLSGLNPGMQYTFTFFGSRVASPPLLIRSTLFTVMGSSNATTTNDATNNVSTPSAPVNDIIPNASGNIVIRLEKAANNDSSTGVGYLGVLAINAESIPTPTPPPVSYTILVDCGPSSGNTTTG